MQNPFHLLKKNPTENKIFKPFSMVLAPLDRPDMANFDGTASSFGFTEDGKKICYYPLKCNSLGFRSDEFKSEHNDGLHILFAGCSETFGEGGPLEDSWAHKTYTAISSAHPTTGYFNIAYPGKGYQDIINLSIQYIESYGPPDHLIIAFPSMLRGSSWVTAEDLDVTENFDKGQFTDGYYMLMPKRYKNSKGKISGEYLMAGNGFKVKDTFDEPDMNTEYVSFYLALKSLEVICKEKQINLLWTLIDITSKEVRKRINDDFKSTFIATLAPDSETLEYMAEHPGTTYEKPDGHRGTADHSIWSEKMVARIFHSINKGDVNAKE